MVHREPPFQLLYVSQLAPGFDFAVVKEIVDVARQRNRELHITGALLFDGERFCQLLEGAQDDVRALMQRIARDPRHIDVRVVLEGVAHGARLMPRWASGYCDPLLIEALGAEGGPRKQAALDAFASMLEDADME